MAALTQDNGHGTLYGKTVIRTVAASISDMDV